jgi:hypothetical protein
MLDAHLAWRGTSVPHLSDGLIRVVTQGPARARAAPKSIVEKLVLAFGGEFLAADHDQVKFLGGDSSGVEPPEIDHQLPADGYHGLFLGRAIGAPQDFLPLLHRWVLGLKREGSARPSRW